MKLFPGATRRVFVTLRNGAKAHLMKRRRVSGPITWCGLIGGTERGFRNVKHWELCSTCASLSGVAELLEESA